MQVQKKLLSTDSFDQALDLCPEYSLGEDSKKNMRIRVDSGTFKESCFSYSMIMPIKQVDGSTVLDYNIVLHQLIRTGVLLDDKVEHAAVDQFKDLVATPVLLHIYTMMQELQDSSEPEGPLLELP